MNHASRMLRITGVPAWAEKRPASTVSRSVSPITAPSEPPTPVISRISPVVWKPSSIVSRVLDPCLRAKQQVASTRPMNSAKFALPRNAMKELEKPKSSAKRAEGDQNQGHQDRQQQHAQRQRSGCIGGTRLGVDTRVGIGGTNSALASASAWTVPASRHLLGAGESHLVGLLLDHRLIDVFVRLGLPEAATQDEAHDDGGDDRRYRTDHDSEKQPSAERYAEQTGDRDRCQARYDEYVAREDAGARAEAMSGSRCGGYRARPSVRRARPAHCTST